MDFSPRQQKIIEIVKQHEPISGDRIASQLGLTKPTLRHDLSLLTMTGVLDARPRVGYIYSGQTIEPLLYDELFRLKIQSIMAQPVFIKQSVSVQDAITDLFIYDCGSLYVLDDEGAFVGLVSRKDLLRAAVNNAQLQQIPVAMIMTRKANIVTITAQERVIDAGYLIINHQVDSLPVIDAEQPTKVIGKISKSKLLSHLILAGYDVEKNKD